MYNLNMLEVSSLADSAVFFQPISLVSSDIDFTLVDFTRALTDH